MTGTMPDNMLKYENYKEQNKRLTKALQNEFYLEAILINVLIKLDWEARFKKSRKICEKII